MEKNIFWKVSAARLLTAIMCLLMAFAIQSLWAQSNPLNRKLTFKVTEDRLDETLDLMGEKGEFTFAYNAQKIPSDSLISLLAQNEKVKKLLDEIFLGSMTYKSVGNHIVLRPVEKPIQKEKRPEWRDITGYLIDGKTGEKIAYATVYDAEKRNSALSRKDGSYRLKVPGNLPTVPVSFSRFGYRDTVVVIRPAANQNLTVGLQPLPQEYLNSQAVSLVGDSYQEELPLANIFVPEVQQRRAFNLNQAIAKFPLQISLLPSIGSNGLMSGGMTNIVSINLLAGYAAGLNGVELGGLANIIREDVKGVQVAGLANTVGGNVSGVQAAGLYNHVKGSCSGVQASGLYNMVKDTMTGIQLGGLFNTIESDIHGFQVAGMFNRARSEMDGAQIAGFTNFAGGDVKWTQVAGFANRAKGSVGGGQVAGFANIAKDSVSGAQISGFYNRARYMKGMQIGIINISDTLDGYAIGLVNWSKNGYKSLGFSHNEVDQIRLEFRSGRQLFYTSLFAGLTLTPNQNAFSYGGGIGSTVSITASLGANFELTTQQVMEEGLGDRLNMVNSFRPSLVYAPTRWLELSAGPGVSLGVANNYGVAGDFGSNIPVNPFYTRDFQTTQLNAWLGYQGALRFCF